MNQPTTLSLADIASWQFPRLTESLNPEPTKEQKTDVSKLIAAIPSLQRGAVWRAGQIEMLWDSILRGFPIGALVVCPRFDGQDFHSGKHGKGGAAEQVTHYLLDGQQRCNAITLGFLDALKTIDGEQPPATLWIDLNPNRSKSSTRQFVLRVLTTSHPWGYSLDDDAKFIGVAAIRKAEEHYEGGKRPAITAAWPHQSQCPLPFSWLIQASFQKEIPTEFWNLILGICQSDANKSRPWAVTAAGLIQAHLDGTKLCPHLERIEAAMKRVRDFRLVALEASQEILRQKSLQEELGAASQPEGEERIHNIEHLFQRLNSAGTELRGEELLFSMIKAYWPSIEKSFAAIQDSRERNFLPMPASRLAVLGIRAALMSEPDKAVWQENLSISQIRGMALDDKKVKQCHLIKNYMGISLEAGQPVRASDSALHVNLHRVDQWLLYSSEDNIGLPPVLRSNLAQGAPEVFLLLLHLAQRSRSLTGEQVIELRRPIIGLATALHWFGHKKEIGNSVKRLLEGLFSAPLSPELFRGILINVARPQGRNPGMLEMLSPDKLMELIPVIPETEKELLAWNFGPRSNEAIVSAEEQKAIERKRELLVRVKGSKHLLLYAQREYMTKQFADYDPSVTDIWAGHDRPWDYDHLLPSAVLHRKQSKFKKPCSEWAGTIANLRACPLEENRSKSDYLASASINTPEERANSLIKEVDESGEDECIAFSIRERDIDNPIASARFMKAARARLLRIYEDWFDSLNIGYLLGNSEEGVTKP